LLLEENEKELKCHSHSDNNVEYDENGNPKLTIWDEVYLLLGFLYWEKGNRKFSSEDTKKAIEYWKLTKDIRRSFFLGRAYADVDPKRSEIEFGFVALMLPGQEDEWSQYMLGFMYGLKKNYEQSIQHYFKSAERGFVLSQYNLSQYYKDGTGLPIDSVKELYWLRCAVDQGHGLAQSNLGICYYQGAGVPRDPQLAVHYFSLAALEGVPMARYNLGLCYQKGFGVKANRKEAEHWFVLAAADGNEDAVRCLTSIKKRLL